MKTTASFIQPFMNPTAPVTVHVDSTDELVEGQTVLIPGGGHYMVSAILSEHQVQLVNLALATNTAPGTTVPRGIVVASGTPGMSTITLGTDLVVDIQTANVIIIPVSLGATGPGAITLFSGSLPIDGTRLIFNDFNEAFGGFGGVNYSVVSSTAHIGSISNYSFTWSHSNEYFDITYSAPGNFWTINEQH